MNKEDIEELNQKIKENPDSEVKFFGNYEIYESDEFTYWECYIEKIIVEDILFELEKCYIGEDKIKDELFEQNEASLQKEIPRLGFEKALKNIYQKKVEENKIKKTIIVYMGI